MKNRPRPLKKRAAPGRLESVRGQATLEALISSLGLVLSISGFLTLCFLAVVHFQIKFEMQRALICLTGKALETCELNFKKNLEPAQIFGKLQNLKLQRQRRERSISLTYRLQAFGGSLFEKHYHLEAIR